eukprot:CAMPEP_0114313612 /NCGR_PEP_ID=MMETSP0059-20121206/21228_1 /TAXON_ID=36894 /ORGANISM="Pyramimonas parkeae, Strain CCMP726" /LENGTH=776 /DNA_ID=CAMNT_0001438419 /DNA_START=256 /DNA_END=2588 /DNA_ORIENTATION=+
MSIRYGYESHWPRAQRWHASQPSVEHEYYARGLEPMRGHLCERSIPCHHFKGKPMQRRTCEREEANVRTRHTFTEREGAWLGIELLLAALQGDVSAICNLLESGAPLESKTDTGATPVMVACGSGIISVARILIDKGSNLYASDNIGATALMLAAFKGHLDIVQLLIERAGHPLKLISQHTRSGETALLAAAKAGHSDIVKLFISYGVSTETGRAMLACEVGASSGLQSVWAGTEHIQPKKGDAAWVGAEGADRGPTLGACAVREANPEFPVMYRSGASCASGAGCQLVSELDQTEEQLWNRLPGSPTHAPAAAPPSATHFQPEDAVDQGSSCFSEDGLEGGLVEFDRPTSAVEAQREGVTNLKIGTNREAYATEAGDSSRGPRLSSKQQVGPLDHLTATDLSEGRYRDPVSEGTSSGGGHARLSADVARSVQALDDVTDPASAHTNGGPRAVGSPGRIDGEDQPPLSRHGVMLGAGAAEDMFRGLASPARVPDPAVEPNLTPLHAASAKGHVAAAEALLEHGACLLARQRSNGRTALMRAAAGGHAAVMLLLTGHRDGLTVAHVEATDATGWTALMYAAKSNQPAACQAMYLAGARLEAKCARGATALGVACQHGCLQTVDWLLDRGADPLSRNSRGESALWAAVLAGHLAEFGVADTIHRRCAFHGEVGVPMMEVRDAYGWTLLGRLAERGDVIAITWAVKNGADLLAEQPGGFLPRQIADRNEHWEAAEYLGLHAAHTLGSLPEVRTQRAFASHAARVSLQMPQYSKSLILDS